LPEISPKIEYSEKGHMEDILQKIKNMALEKIKLLTKDQLDKEN
jgi:hypothetical protein